MKTDIELLMENLLFKYFQFKNEFDIWVCLFHTKENYCIRFNYEKERIEIRNPFKNEFNPLYYYTPEEKVNDFYTEMLEQTINL